MLSEKYIVLRTRELTAPARGDLGRHARIRSMDALEVSPSVMRLEEVDLTKRERNDLRRDPSARAIALSMPMKLIAPVKSRTVAPAAPGAKNWGIEAVRASESPYDGTGVTVAVLDTGIDANHPAFAGVDLVQQNYTSEAATDLHGHGTHCAGTIFGRDVDGTRIGIARNVKRALIGKVLGENEGGDSATLAKAIQWAIHEGANVISMSLGIDFPGYVKSLQEEKKMDIYPATSMALEEYRANVNLFTEMARMIEAEEPFTQGAVIVAASGNESNRPAYEIAVAPPAAGTGIISIGALGKTPQGFAVAQFSNNQVDVSAPGVDILSARAGTKGLVTMSGTSMATPHAAGIAALWAQRQLDMTGRIEGRSLTAQLIGNAIFTPLAPGYQEDDVGSGIIQAPVK
jgi:subtilisin family serine protease